MRPTAGPDKLSGLSGLVSSMRILVFILLLAFSTGLRAQTATCPIAGITTTQIGQGAGLTLAPPGISLALDQGPCALDLSVTAFACCNTFVSSHFVAVGTGPLFAPTLLPPPFVVGALLYIQPDVIVGPFPGTMSSFPLPASPALVGLTAYIQAAPVYFTTIGFTTDIGVTPAVAVTFN